MDGVHCIQRPNGNYRVWFDRGGAKLVTRTIRAADESEAVDRWRAIANPQLLKLGIRVAVCSRCKAFGWEVPGIDPAPDLCPGCYAALLAQRLKEVQHG